MLRTLFGFDRTNRPPQRRAPAPKAVRPRTRQPLLEELESRLAPACVEVFTPPGPWVIRCGPGPETVTTELLRSFPPQQHVIGGGLDKMYLCSDISHLKVNMGTAGGNTVNVRGICSGGMDMVINDGNYGGPGDRVVVGNPLPNHGVQDIFGPLTIKNHSYGANTIIVDDTTDPWNGWTGTTVLDTDPGNDFGRIRDLARVPITYDCGATASVTINTSRIDGNVVDVLKTCVSTTLNGNGDTTTLTTVRVGNGVNGVQDILGPLNITNVPSYTQLTLNDTTNPVGGRHAVLSADNVTGLVRGLAPADITYQTSFADVRGLTINAANSSSNTFCVLSTFAFTPVTINTGAMHDTINIGNSLTGLSDIRSTVNVMDGTLFDTINLINVGGPNDAYWVNAANVTDMTLGFMIVTFNNPRLVQYWSNSVGDMWVDNTAGAFLVQPGVGLPPC